MKNNYTIPTNTTIGHVHLKVSNLQRSIDFYCGLLGFTLMQKMGQQAAFVSAGGYHHHIGLNTWSSEGGVSPSTFTTGLYHLAIRLPGREDLAVIYRRLLQHPYPLVGAADHGVSEALYLDDPDQNGVELYWDRAKAEWPYDENGQLKMYTRPLDLQELHDLVK